MKQEPEQKQEHKLQKQIQQQNLLSPNANNNLKYRTNSLEPSNKSMSSPTSISSNGVITKHPINQAQTKTSNCNNTASRSNSGSSSGTVTGHSKQEFQQKNSQRNQQPQQHNMNHDNTPMQRKYYFDDEESNSANLSLRKSYTFSNCIMRCRVRIISALCGCVPFFVAIELINKLGVPYFSLHHVSCMHRYKFKWQNVLTKRIRILGIERELEEALYCAQCLSSCDDTQHDISIMSLPTDRLVIPDNVGDDFNLKVEDMSVLRVYFGASTALCYKRVINNTWEEAFSTVGNIVSIFLGFSMVAIFEILFFVIKYLYIALKIFVLNSQSNSKLIKNQNKVKSKSNELYILP